MKKAEEACNKASCAIQAVEQELVFKDFKETSENGSVPQLTMATGGELILVYQGNEFCQEDILKIMQEKGYIEPSDFGDISI